MAGKFSSVTGSSREISNAAYRSRDSQQKTGIHWEEASRDAHTFREKGHLQSRGGTWETAKSRLFLRTGFYWGRGDVEEVVCFMSLKSFPLLI